jgi:hypothetical protein
MQTESAMSREDLSVKLSWHFAALKKEKSSAVNALILMT